jgi:hypothetical protein
VNSITPVSAARCLSLGLLLGLLPAIASAHTASPFLLPDQFDLKTDNVTVQSAITVEKFFVPNRNYASQFTLTTPDGKTSSIKPAADLKRFSLLDIDTPQDGTYRISSQQSTAQRSESRYALIDGHWLRIRTPRPDRASTDQKTDQKPVTAEKQQKAAETKQPPRFIAEDQVPKNTQTMISYTQQRADTYFSKSAPTPLTQPSGKGLELQLISHPNDTYAGDSFRLVALYDGQPIPNLELDVFKGASSYERDANREHPAVTTDAKGQAAIPFEKAGLYLITTRYPAENTDTTQPPASQVEVYGLTLEVAP